MLPLFVFAFVVLFVVGVAVFAVVVRGVPQTNLVVAPAHVLRRKNRA